MSVIPKFDCAVPIQIQWSCNKQIKSKIPTKWTVTSVKSDVNFYKEKINPHKTHEEK